MPTFEIKSHTTGAVLFAGDYPSLRMCVQSAILRGSDLRDSNLSRSNLRGSNLSGSNLRGSNLSGSNLRDSDLSRSNLSRSNLRGSNLSGSDLRGSDLSDSDLSRSNLSGSDLSGSDLSGSDLSGSDLRGSNLSGSDLSGVYDVIPLGQPDGWWAYAYQTATGICVRVGCQTKTMEEARAYWAGKDARREVIAALDYAEAVATIRGWK